MYIISTNPCHHFVFLYISWNLGLIDNLQIMATYLMWFNISSKLRRKEYVRFFFWVSRIDEDIPIHVWLIERVVDMATTVIWILFFTLLLRLAR